MKHYRKTNLQRNLKQYSKSCTNETIHNSRFDENHGIDKAIDNESSVINISSFHGEAGPSLWREGIKRYLEAPCAPHVLYYFQKVKKIFVEHH